MRFKLLFFLLLFQSYQTFSQGELLIFINEKSPISQDLMTQDLPAIRQMAIEQNLNVKYITVSDVAPPEIAFTPTIVFQNHLGRSVYKGRYKAIDRLTNFVRIARQEAQILQEYSKDSVLFYKNEQIGIAVPIKITELTGELPNAFSQVDFHAVALEAIKASMAIFQFKSNVILPAQSRLFYMDIHPYRSVEGKLFLSTKIYSGFSCVEPVFESKKPILGDFSGFEKLFFEVGSDLEKIILDQLKNTTYGDGIEFIPKGIKSASFEDMGFPLPEKQVKKTSENLLNSKLKITSKKWAFDQAISKNTPVLQFQFPAPLDHYAGEAKKITMQLETAEVGNLHAAKGKIEVATKSITMGDSALDNHILNEYILSDKHAISSYDFEIIDAPERLVPGKIHEIKLHGTLQMKGIEVKIPAEGTVELIADSIGNPQLRIAGKFNMAIRELFGIKGPDGPKEASDNLSFKLNFLMRQTESFQSSKVFKKIAQNYSKHLERKFSNSTENENQNDLGRISWSASSPVYKAKGIFKKWKITNLNLPADNLEKIEVSLEIDMASISEKSQLLVKHVKSRKFLDVEKYPLSKIKIQGTKRQKNGTYLGIASTELKGITANVPIVFEVISELPLTVKGTCEISRKIFKVGKVKKFLGVSKNVKVEVIAILDSKQIHEDN